ncbi:hypothetical protein N7540_009685 [Penicillium herquei]|nr:hypothetical protein N7540_009685 [Penicillium herquei]
MAATSGSTINLSQEDDERNYRHYYMANYSQAQAQQFPHVSLNQGWRWSEGVRPTSTQTWSAVSPSQVMYTVEGSDWNLNTLPQTNPVNLAISTGLNHLTPNPNLNYCPEGMTATSSPQTDSISLGEWPMEPSGQAGYEENNYTAPGAQSQAYLSASSKRTRRLQQYVFLKSLDIFC